MKIWTIASIVVLGFIAGITPGCADKSLPTAVVDPTGETGGSYRTIASAIDAMPEGGRVLVKGGVYRECLRITRKYDRRLLIQAATGERVILDGFTAVKDWKEEGDGVYSAKTQDEVPLLYVGYRPQQCSRWPADGTRLPVVNVDSTTSSFKVDPVAGNAALQAVAKDPKNAVLYLYIAAGNYFRSPAIEKYDPAAGTLSTGKVNWWRGVKQEGNAYAIMNHPALIRNPGDWAFVSDASGNGGTVYFKPASPDDLECTAYPGPQKAIVDFANAENVVFDGFEVTGSANAGISIGAKRVEVRNCIVHHNTGFGISVRRASDITVRSCISFANFTGLNIAAVDGMLVEGNEIAHNLMDGLVVSGNITGKPTGTPGADPATKNVVVRRNYLHHHYHLAHPDNFQMYRDVSNITIEENVDIWGFQSLMAEEVRGAVLRGNAFAISGSSMVICGHANSDEWTFTGNSFWGPFYNAVTLTGRDYVIENCLFAGCPVHYDDIARNKVVSKNNCFSPSYLGLTANPHRQLKSLKEAQDECGLETGSVAVDAKIANMPVSMSVGHADGSSVDSLAMHRKTKPDFCRVGDIVELNGDGRPRRVVSFDGKTLKFTPALVAPPFRYTMVANWRDTKSMQLDFATDQPYGAKVSILDFANGDLLGKGERTLPKLSADLLAAWPDPNHLVYPPKGN